MLEEIVPPVVVVEEAFDDTAPVALFPEEEAALGRAVEKRRQEFATARLCARRALARLGLPASPVVPGQRGVPGWPPGVVGSITHCAGYRAVALARRRHLTALGIDAEPDEPLPADVLDLVARPEERAALGSLERQLAPMLSADRLLFSAKEAVFKAWYPVTRRELEFEDVAVVFAPADRAFSAHIHIAPDTPEVRHLIRLAGRWLARDGQIVTAVAVPAR